jgi:hypothetical protein
MVEWHVTPDYLTTHWTEELLRLMVEKLVARKSVKPPPVTGQASKSKDRMVSDEELFGMLGSKFHRVKHGS